MITPKDRDGEMNSQRLHRFINFHFPINVGAAGGAWLHACMVHHVRLNHLLTGYHIHSLKLSIVPNPAHLLELPIHPPELH